MKKEDQIRKIDGELKALMEERLKLTLEAQKDMTVSEAALASRKYERAFMNDLQDSDINMESIKRTFFRQVFNLSRSYTASESVKDSKIRADIEAALESTGKEFPRSALVACQGI